MELLKVNIQPAELLDTDERLEEGRYCLALSPKGDEIVELTEVSAVFRFDFEKDDALFLNGFQSWTYSPERNRKQFDKAMRFVPRALDRKYGFSQYGDGYFSDPVHRKELRAGYKKGWSYAYVRRGERYALFASLAEGTGFTRIVLNTADSTVSFQKDCRGRFLAPGERYTALDVIFPEGEEREVFDRWFELMGVQALPAEPKIGYTSWYNCYQNISEAQILRDLEGMKTLPVKPHIFQIDDGFEPFVGDWLTVNPEKFPTVWSPSLKRSWPRAIRPASGWRPSWRSGTPPSTGSIPSGSSTGRASGFSPAPTGPGASRWIPITRRSGTTSARALSASRPWASPSSSWTSSTPPV